MASPRFDGADQLAVRLPLPSVRLGAPGVAGAPGVPVVSDDQSLLPRALRARTLTW